MTEVRIGLALAVFGYLFWRKSRHVRLFDLLPWALNMATWNLYRLTPQMLVEAFVAFGDGRERSGGIGR